MGNDSETRGMAMGLALLVMAMMIIIPLWIMYWLGKRVDPRTRMEAVIWCAVTLFAYPTGLYLLGFTDGMSPSDRHDFLIGQALFGAFGGYCGVCLSDWRGVFGIPREEPTPAPRPVPELPDYDDFGEPDPIDDGRGRREPGDVAASTAADAAPHPERKPRRRTGGWEAWNAGEFSPRKGKRPA